MKWCAFIIIASLAISCINQKRATDSQKIARPGMIETASGLKYVILKKGGGPLAKVGDQVLLYETTTYLNGTILYSNEDTGIPVKVLIGGHQATEGVDEGLRGMQVGEVRKLILTPALAKRTSYPDSVSPDSSIVVKVELHKIL